MHPLLFSYVIMPPFPLFPYGAVGRASPRFPCLFVYLLFPLFTRNTPITLPLSLLSSFSEYLLVLYIRPRVNTQ